jgi:hypothetical protein
MTKLIVNSENQITVAPVPAENAETPIAPGKIFGTAAEFSTLLAGWPAARLVAIWNNLPEVAPVKKFTDRRTAIARIWKALLREWPEIGPQEVSVASETSRHGRTRREARKPRTARESSKAGQIIRLLKRASGATLDQLVKATSWQPHTVRGFISGGLRTKMGIEVESSRRPDGARVYRIQS